MPQVSSLPAASLAAYTLVPRYYLALVLAALVTATAWWLTRSRFGYGLVAVITYLGGVGTVLGPPIGAVFFLVLQEALALRLGELHLLVFGILFIAVVVALPGGFMELVRTFPPPRRSGAGIRLDSDGTSTP